MKIELAIGIRTQDVVIEDKNFAGELVANPVKYELTGKEEVERALRSPIAAPGLREIVSPGEKVVIVTSDITRPCPSYKIIPAILDELYEAEIKKEDITVVFGLGSHRKQTEAEQRQLVGDKVFEEVRCRDSDPEDTVDFGTTKSGTPVKIDRTVAEADRRILVGNIEYHYFAGYSGGAKAIMPGVSTPEAIQCNHRFMVKDEAYAGHIKGNPVREDIEEAAQMVGVDYIVNVVLDEDKEIIKAVAGDITAAHREGCAFLDKLYKVEIEERADVVLVSQGGAPKDLNLYQLQKALDNAKHAVKEGGVIILIGACNEGLGSVKFEEWMTGHEKASDMIEHIQNDFQLGGHKAAAIAQVMEKTDVYLVSEMDETFVRSIFFTPYKDIQSAYDDAIKKMGKESTVLVMAHGGSVLPICKGGK